jgi:hypothetical protein
MSGWIKDRFMKNDVGRAPRVSLTSGGAIPKNSLCLFAVDTRHVTVATPRSGAALVCVHSADVSAEDAAADLVVPFATGGTVSGIADVAITAGQVLTAGYSGTIAPLALSDIALLTAQAGTGFTNQPANDTVEIVSSSALDTQTVTVWGTSNGSGAITSESIVLTGTTAVTTIKTDWGVILGVEITSGPAAAGTITFREGSGNLAITTIAASAKSSGIAYQRNGAQVAYSTRFAIVAGGSSTKNVGFVGTTLSRGTQTEVVTLTSTVEVVSSVQWRTIDKILVGDVANSSTVTVSAANCAGNFDCILGLATEDIAAGATGSFEFLPANDWLGGIKRAGESIHYSVSRTFTAAQVQSMNTTIQTLLRKPADSQTIIFLGAKFSWDYVDTVFGGIHADEDFAIKYTNASGVSVAEVETTGFLDQTSDQVRYAYPNGVDGVMLPQIVPVAGASLTLGLLVGGITGGTNSTLTVTVYYKLI